MSNEKINQIIAKGIKDAFADGTNAGFRQGYREAAYQLLKRLEPLDTSDPFLYAKNVLTTISDFLGEAIEATPSKDDYLNENQQ